MTLFEKLYLQHILVIATLNGLDFFHWYLLKCKNVIEQSELMSGLVSVAKGNGSRKVTFFTMLLQFCKSKF